MLLTEAEVIVENFKYINTKKEERKMQIKVSVVGRRGTDGLARIAPRQCLPPCTSHTPNYKQLQQHQHRKVDIGHMT